MTKQELARTVAKSAGIKSDEAVKAVDAMFETLIEKLKAKESVFILGFGTFKIKGVKERAGRNPRTGENMVIPAHAKVVFSPSSDIKEAVEK